MDYRVAPFSSVWEKGIFNVPVVIVDRYLKIASEYQLKALLLIFRNGGAATSQEIAKALGQTAGDIDELMEFWVEEGIVALNGEVKEVTPPPAPVKEEPAKKPVKETLSAPRLSPKDIVAMARDDASISFLLNEAQRVLGRTISHAEQEMLINMVSYYGLKVEVILMILEFYRSEKEKGKAIGISYVNTMAKNWSDEGIDSIALAEEKLLSIEKSDRQWNEIVSMTGIRHRRPTQSQRDMVSAWFADFDIAMISLACDIMKENLPEPKLKYMDSILKKWKKNDITSPAQVQAQAEEFERQKQAKAERSKGSDKLKSQPSYDMEKIKKDALNNTEI